jgi:predicted ATPase
MTADSDQPSADNLTMVGLHGQATSFVGREREIAEVKRLLSQTRLLTLSGAGGCGKTRLALYVAAELLSEYADGVGVVELGALTDPALVPQVVAANLEVREQLHQPVLSTLAQELRGQRLLVVLDNCEHLIEACARLSSVLLRHCPNLQILATSREPLGLAGEVVWRVPSLGVPPPDALPPFESLLEYAGIRLFVERAVAAAPSFRLTQQNAVAVAQVCYRLDGIPLAIELAAARIPTLSTVQIAARLGDRFGLLTSAANGIALPRHQTLRALIDWSYERLDAPERRLFNRLAVFAGGWTLEAAEIVCSDVSAMQHSIQPEGVFALLAELVDKSLVVADAGSNPGQAVRYRLLETMQQYAEEKLRESGEEPALQQRHQSCGGRASRGPSGGRRLAGMGGTTGRRTRQSEGSARAEPVDRRAGQRSGGAEAAARRRALALLGEARVLERGAAVVERDTRRTVPALGGTSEGAPRRGNAGGRSR